MRKLWLVAGLIGLLASAQETTTAGFEMWTPLSLKQLGQPLIGEAATDPHRFAVRLLSDYPHDSFMLVHREADGPPEWHEAQADVFFVQSGAATLIVGGTLVNGETVAPHEKRNGTIKGGPARKFQPEI